VFVIDIFIADLVHKINDAICVQVMWPTAVQAQISRSHMTYESQITAVVWRPLDSVVRFSSHGVERAFVAIWGRRIAAKYETSKNNRKKKTRKLLPQHSVVVLLIG